MLGVTASTSIIVATLLADRPAVPYRHGVSLLHGNTVPMVLPRMSDIREFRSRG